MRTLLLALAACAAVPGFAQGWSPERALEIVAGSGAGGAQDRTARTMQRIWKDRAIIAGTINVVNKPGGGGALSLSYLNQHSGDGHYIAVGSPSILIGHILGTGKFSYTDTTALALLFSEYITIAVRSESPIKDGADLIRRLKADPAAISAAVATARNGMQHIAVGRLARAAGVDVQKVRVAVFNSGGESITQVLGGHIDIVATAAANAAPHVAAGRLRVLGVAAPQRMAGALAGVPTWREQGADVVVSNWRSVVGPRGMSPAQVAWWDGALAKLVQTADWEEEMRTNYWVNNYLGSAESRQFFAAQYEELRGVLKDLMAR